MVIILIIPGMIAITLIVGKGLSSVRFSKEVATLFSHSKIQNRHRRDYPVTTKEIQWVRPTWKHGSVKCQITKRKMERLFPSQ
jgi:hypothetical protein